MISYRHKVSPRARCLRITVTSCGQVTVVRPWFIPQIQADNFVGKKIDWILKTVKKLTVKKRYASNLPRRDRRSYLKLKNQALVLVTKTIVKYNQVYKFKHNQIRIKNQKSRWGSCSKNKNLNFSYRLVYLPQKLAEYIIVHELCHLGQLNHSRKFWDLVSLAFPDYRQIKKELKKV